MVPFTFYFYPAAAYVALKRVYTFKEIIEPTTYYQPGRAALHSSVT